MYHILNENAFYTWRLTMKKRFLTFILTIMAMLTCVFGLSACNTVEFKVNFVVDGEVYTSSGEYYGNSYWWLRSPYYNYSFYARLVGHNGYANYNNHVDYTFGVVPALKIQL